MSSITLSNLDYSILKQVQTVLPDLGRPKEEFVFFDRSRKAFGMKRHQRFPVCYAVFPISSRTKKGPEGPLV
jgi:hypothetical protein